MRRKSFAEIQIEVLSSAEVFVTKYSYFPLFSLPAFLAIVFSFQAFYIKPFNILVLIPGIIIIILFIIRYYFILNKIVVYEKYLGIKGAFGKLKNAYFMDDIVSISFYQGRNGESMNILVLDNGKICRNNYSIQARSKDLEELRQLLMERDVVIRP